MSDYQPLDLTALCNAGVDFAGGDASPALGAQLFHGLPFLIGGDEPDPARCFLGFAPDAGLGGPITIPISGTARTVLVAHVLLESRLFEGDCVGHVAAHYLFRYTD